MDVSIFKALSDGNRLKILEMLVDGEICACKILEALNITQPTLSHHMKILQQCGLVKSRKVEQWSYYSVNTDEVSEIIDYFSEIRNKLNKLIVPD